MRAIEHIAQIDEARRRASRHCEPSITNLFAPRDEIQRWIVERSVHAIEWRGVTLLLRERGGVRRLFFISGGRDSLRQALEHAHWTTGSSVVADLIGRTVDADALLEIFQQHGFSKRALLFRMVASGCEPPAPMSRTTCTTEIAKVDSCNWIVKSLRNCFDPVVEQVPGDDEIRLAVAGRNVILARQSGNASGFLYFERTGLTAIVRYWLVDPRCRGSGAGSALMRAFLAENADLKRILLWVLADNEDAIRKYEHYGFAKEGLLDYVVIRQ